MTAKKTWQIKKADPLQLNRFSYVKLWRPRKTTLLRSGIYFLTMTTAMNHILHLICMFCSVTAILVLFCFVLFNLLGYIVSSHHCAIFIVQRSESAMCISYQSEWPSSRNLETTNAGEVVKKRERTLLHYWGECKLIQSL